MYQYRDLTKEGYERFHLTKKEYHKFFTKRKGHWLERNEYYRNENEIIIDRYDNNISVILNTIFFPLTLLMQGIANTPELVKELKRLYNQKEKGFFMRSTVRKTNPKYEQIVNYIRAKK